MVKMGVSKPINWPEDGVAFIGNNLIQNIPKNAEELTKQYVGINRNPLKPNKKVEIRPSRINHENAGMGLFSTTTILKGHLVGKYLGLLCKSNEDRNSQYVCEYAPGKAQDPSEEEGKWAVDAKQVGNETRFINHSEDRANVAAECVGSNGSNNEHRLIYIHQSD